MSEPTKETMLEILKEWFANFWSHPIGLENDFTQEELVKFFQPHNEVFKAVRRLIEKFPEWQKRAKDLTNPREIHSNNLSILRLVQDIRDFKMTEENKAGVRIKEKKEVK